MLSISLTMVPTSITIFLITPYLKITSLVSNKAPRTFYWQFLPSIFLGSFWSLHHKYPVQVLASLDDLLFQHTMHACTSATSIIFCPSAWIFFSSLTNSKLLSFSSNDIYDWFNLTMLHISSMSCSLKRTFVSIIYWKATRACRICWEGITIWILQMKTLRLKVGRELWP